MNKPVILVTNDDGFTAKGIASLIEVAKKFGQVLVVAPDKPQSGMGHAITVNMPLRATKTDYFGDIEAYHTSGTPVDCVKLGMYFLKGKKPDLILSGVNHGSNVSTNVLYSGTMSAAVEGALEGVPSIGFSLTDYDPDADFSASKVIIEKIVKKTLEEGMTPGVCLNVNIPKLPIEEIKGIKFCRQARAFWDDTFDERKDPLNKQYYWLTGDFYDHDGGEDADMYVLSNGYVSVVPTQFDLTAYDELNKFREWKL